MTISRKAVLNARERNDVYVLRNDESPPVKRLLVVHEEGFECINWVNRAMDIRESADLRGSVEANALYFALLHIADDLVGYGGDEIKVEKFVFTYDLSDGTGVEDIQIDGRDPVEGFWQCDHIGDGQFDVEWLSLEDPRLEIAA